MNNLKWGNIIYCFKDKKRIEANACNRCYLYYRICKNLYKRSYKCFDSGETLGEYDLERLRIFMEGVNGMISTKEIMKFLAKEYGLEIDQSLVFKYAKKGLITKIKKEGLGKAKGVQTLWEDSAKYKVYFTTKQLLKECKLTLEEVSKYKNLIYPFNESEINKLYTITGRLNIECAKFGKVVEAFACAEADHKPGLNIMAINGKIFMPQMYVKKEKNRIIEIHIKIIDLNILGSSIGKAIKDIEAYKEIIYSKRGIEKIA